MAAHELFAELLGHAAGHANHRAGIGPLHAAERAVHLLLRLFTHGTGVDEHHIGLLQRLFLKAQTHERTLHPLGVVDVHLTAERDAVKSALAHLIS